MSALRKALWLDFDGTLCAHRFWSSAPPLVQKYMRENIFGAECTYVHSWMKGLISSEEVNRKVADALQIEFRPLWNSFVSDCRGFRIPESILHKLRMLQ